MWEIKPKKSAGPLRLGMPIEEAIDVLGSDFRKLKRSPIDSGSLYAFNSKSVHVACDASDVVHTISLFPPNQVSYQGIKMLDRPTEEVLEDLKAQSIFPERTGGGYWVASDQILIVDVDGRVDGLEATLVS